jgi:hypothetical protein
LAEERKYSAEVWELARKDCQKTIDMIIRDKSHEAEVWHKECMRLRKKLSLDPFTGYKLNPDGTVKYPDEED